MSVLAQLVAGGMTMVLTTHEPEVASALADRGVLMRDGRVLRSGPLGELITSELLSATYGSDITVSQAGGRRVTFWY